MGDKEFGEILNELSELHIKKDNDYGSKVLDIIGLKGITIYLVSKSLRLNNLLSGNIRTVENEKLEDTIKDLAVYAVLGIQQLRKNGTDK